MTVGGREERNASAWPGAVASPTKLWPKLPSLPLSLTSVLLRPQTSYSNELLKYSKSRMAHTGRPWTAAEDHLLTQAVALHGEADQWKAIALCVPGRTNKACRKVDKIDNTVLRLFT
jgi:hypothetical protein